jgi:hypothetical protein
LFAINLREHAQGKGRIMIADEILINWFTYHLPSNEQQEAYKRLRNRALDLARDINECVPDCADKTASIRKLRECIMTANAAIACGGK